MKVHLFGLWRSFGAFRSGAKDLGSGLVSGFRFWELGGGGGRFEALGFQLAFKIEKRIAGINHEPQTLHPL